MNDAKTFPLDLQKTAYSYVERPNTVLVSLLEKHVLRKAPRARILDVGCGAGANAVEIKKAHPEVRYQGVEPNARAAELAREVMDDVFHGMMEDWLATNPTETYDAVILSDVVEHVVDPVAFMRRLAEHPATRGATFVISVPNYAVWYNRIATLFGRFRYAWSGLYDRTHLRFYTRRSIREILEYCGLRVVDDECTPSLVQSAAPVLRTFFEKDVAQGQHLALTESPAFRAYRTFVEPVERVVCGAWPELLGFQIVTVARHR
jgi:2-polyprenyl-3-methyl-5-hydroxy-6-metoxy-1,4-benzoquinol methylase